VSSVTSGCSPATALQGAAAVATSSDGHNVYVASASDGSVSSFARASSGALTQLKGNAGCISEDGSGGGCAQGGGLTGAAALAVPADGRNVYVAGDGAVAIFQRAATTGALSELAGSAACVSSPSSDDGDPGLPGSSVDNCAPGNGLDSPSDVAVSPDAKNVYVLSGDAIAVFSRGTSGALKQLAGTAGCVSSDGSNGTCSEMPTLDGALSLAISPDGKSVYVAAFLSNMILVVARNPQTGQLAPLSGSRGCLSADGSGGACRSARELDSPTMVAVSPDGTSVYTSASTAVVAFARNPDGTLSQLPAAAGCISDGGSGGACTPGRSMIGPQYLSVSPDGHNVYVTTAQGGDVPVYESLNVFARSATPASLHVRTSGPGKVISEPHGISCPNACTATFNPGTRVTLHATPAKGWHFIGWSQGCSGIHTCVLTINRTATIGATFRKTRS
jgi:DNA-binding beta-propeller fold protein YncE